MTAQLIVPVDGSPTAWTALDVAEVIAARTGATIRLVEVVFSPVDTASAKARLHEHLAHRGWPEGIECEVLLSADTVAAGVMTLLEHLPDATVVMSSHGRGRSAGILGSVANDLLQRAIGPIVVVGPHATAGTLGGPVIIPVDGSTESEQALALGSSWSIALGVDPWIVHVSEPGAQLPQNDLLESVYPGRLARELHASTGQRIEFEELHGKDPARAIVDFAERREAALIVATSHSRIGLRRFAVGSVAADVVRHAPCPVVLRSGPKRDH